MHRFAYPRKPHIFAALLFLCLCLLAVPSFASPAPPGYHRIVLLSDPHLPVRAAKAADQSRQNKIIAAKSKLVDDINAWEDVGEIVVLGDIAASRGTTDEYAYAAGYFAKFNAPRVFITGNHDYIYRDEPNENGRSVRGDARSRRDKLQRFKKTFGLPELHHTQKIGAYLLVFLSLDSPDSPHLAAISGRQLDWLKEELKKNPSAPTIIFCHAPLAGTLAQYNKSVNTPNYIAQPEQKLAEIIAGNPQIFLWVSGHTHTPADNPSFASAVNLYAGRVTNIHNTDLDREVIWTNSLYLYADKVIVKTFNHKKGVWVDELERAFPLPQVNNNSGNM
ncbi:metallophosphoesterase family protein [Anaeroselena agilis]|uniref:Metallophosphoesterase n=1 Tax=Anaeroselena agilis TaxID=3063788 RepID=A0ABU3P018_9FIRM|nr:metallophosphoesterase [Selenomonadales bacterium 4137-cl]